MKKSQHHRVAVIAGGVNAEHDVSLASARSIASAIAELGMHPVPLFVGRDGLWRNENDSVLLAHQAVEIITGCDVAFPTIHGINGEDGAVAGLLEMCQVPYVGSGVRPGALGMDKWITKLAAESLGIQTARGQVMGPKDQVDHSTVSFPAVVKPVSGGSSHGVTSVSSYEELLLAVAFARSHSATVLIEDQIKGKEVDIAIFRDGNGDLRLGSTLEIGVIEGDIFGNKEKYDGNAQFTVPACISLEQTQEIESHAVLLYETLGCSGVARFDFFVTEETVILNEINTAPGMTEQSQVPLIYSDGARVSGYKELIFELLEATY